MTGPLDDVLSTRDGYPYSRFQVEGIVLVVIITFIAVVICGLRVYSRISTRAFGADDWLMCAATFFAINQCWACILFMRAGFVGVHVADIPLPVAENHVKLWSWLGQVFYAPILPLVKCSILVFLLRLGGRQKKGVRMALTALHIFNVLQVIAVLLVTILQCSPVHLAWTASSSNPRRDMPGHCISLPPYTLTIGAVNIITDLLILIFPFLIFMDISINKRIRNALIGVFCISLIIPILSAVRLYVVYRDFYIPSPDPTYNIGPVMSPVEGGLAIALASVPPLWPLARRWFPAMDDMLGINRHHQPDIEVQIFNDSGGTAATAVATPGGSVGFPMVKVKWARTDAVRRGHGHGRGREPSESPNLATATNGSGSTPGTKSGEGSSGDRMRLGPPSPFPLPSSTLPSPWTAAAPQEEPKDYFSVGQVMDNDNPTSSLGRGGGGGDRGVPPDRDLYHGMIHGSGQQSPFGHDGNTLDTALHSTAQRVELESESAAFRRAVEANQHHHHAAAGMILAVSVPAMTYRVAALSNNSRPAMPPRANTAPAGFRLTLPPQKRRKTVAGAAAPLPKKTGQS